MNYLMRYLPAYHPCSMGAQVVYGNLEKSMRQWHLLHTLKSLRWS